MLSNGALKADGNSPIETCAAGEGFDWHHRGFTLLRLLLLLELGSISILDGL
jgi:hypothetical protein